jgi:hypothetical protein
MGIQGKKMNIFTILDTKGQHGNIVVDGIKNNLPNLEIHTIFKYINENNIVFKGLRKFFPKSYMKYRNRKARLFFNEKKYSEDLYICFGGDFIRLANTKSVIYIDDPVFSRQELTNINQKNVVQIIVTTEDIKKKYLEYNIKKNIVVIPPCVSTSFIKKIPHSDFNVFYYGHRINKHDIEVLNLIAERVKNINNIKLNVAGSFTGEQRETNLNRDVNFLGHLTHSEIKEQLKRTDLGLYIRHDSELVSLRISIKIIEMFAAGIPVLSNPTRRITDNYGWIVNDENFPEQVVWCYDNRKEVLEKGACAAKHARVYNIDHVMPIIISTLKKISSEEFPKIYE